MHASRLITTAGILAVATTGPACSEAAAPEETETHELDAAQAKFDAELEKLDAVMKHIAHEREGDIHTDVSMPSVADIERKLCVYARKLQGSQQPYFFIGGYASASVFALSASIGIDIVFDYWHHQAAVFQSRGGSKPFISYAVGASAGVYAGLMAGAARNVKEAWEGPFVSASFSWAVAPEVLPLIHGNVFLFGSAPGSGNMKGFGGGVSLDMDIAHVVSFDKSVALGGTYATQWPAATYLLGTKLDGPGATFHPPNSTQPEYVQYENGLDTGSAMLYVVGMNGGGVAGAAAVLPVAALALASDRFDVSDGFEDYTFDAELVIEFGEKPDPFTGADGSPLPLPGDAPSWPAKKTTSSAPTNGGGGGAKSTIQCEIDQVPPGAASTGTYSCTRYCPSGQRSLTDWTVAPAITTRTSPFGCEDKTNPSTGQHFVQCHVEADVGKMSKHTFTVHCQ